MSISPDRPHADLAGALRRLRKAAGLSGERLAARCAMSQSKISRIESGSTLPSVLDVERILAALEVPGDAAAELAAIARRANVEHTSWRAVAENGLWRKQVELRALAESARELRFFLPAVLSGLLQIPEYARAALTPIVETDPCRDVDKALQARLERQVNLDDEARTFTFLLTEQAIRWRYVDRSIMVRQCERLLAVAEMSNVDICVIPISSVIPKGPLSTFVIYDHRLVVTELLSGEVSLNDPKDVQHHLAVFDYFLKYALCGTRTISFLHSVRDDFM